MSRPESERASERARSWINVGTPLEIEELLKLSDAFRTYETNKPITE